MENKRKIYELPISKNYVRDWGVEEAVREVMQNAIDSESDGNELEISYNSGVLRVTNRGCNLDISSLVLGSTTKADGGYIGSKGEGNKLALAVLLREGLIPTIYTDGQKWEASFRKSRKFKIETLHIDVYEDDNYERDIVEFEIKGMNYELFKNIRSKNIAILRNMGHGVGDYEESEYGEILLDKEFAGKMFVEGLFIQADNTFKYGYNFKSEYVSLDRDRKAIDYYKLKELTAKALSSQDNIEIVHNSISKSYIDTKSLENVIDEASDEFIDNFTHDFINRHELDDDVFVGTDKEVELSGKENTFVATAIVAEIINKGLDKEEEYEEVKQKISGLSDIESAWNSYNNSDLETLFKMIKSWDYTLSINEVDKLKKFMSGSWKLRTTYFNLIKDDIFKDFYPKKDKEELDGTEE